MNFAQEIIAWYTINKRDLPWRNTTDPYIIWLSEIILQQTRVEQGTPYFFRFAEAYPTVAQFAGASEDEILNLWQGLGYYSRGRNMLTTARLIMHQHRGIFPKSYLELIQLKGIGEYTAAAISSFAGNEAKAVVDGNVFRLLSRYFGIYDPINSSGGKKKFVDLANELIDKENPGLFNQGIMEFGSLVCSPKNPRCNICPLSLTCFAFKNSKIPELPVKTKSKKSTERHFNYFLLLKDEEFILLNKRGPKDIWQNLYDLPLLESERALSLYELQARPELRRLFGEQLNLTELAGPVKHILSHQRIFARFYLIENFDEQYVAEKDWFYVTLNDLANYAQPKLIFEFFQNFSKLKNYQF